MAVPTNQTILDNLRSALNTLATNGGAVEVVQADGRRVRYTDPEQLLKLITHYENEIAEAVAVASNKPARTYASFARRPI